jgi:hypothetical protein
MLKDQIANSLAAATALLCVAGVLSAVAMARATRFARALVPMKPPRRTAVARRNLA